MQKRIFLFTAFLLGSNVGFCQSGVLDSTFNDDGIVITDIGVNTNDFLYDIAIQPDQKILAVGSVNIGGNVDFAVVRYQPDGTPDPDFGTNGLTLIDFSNSDDAGHAIALQPDGKIVLAGVTQHNGQADFAVARLNSDGTADSTFGVAGKVISALGQDYDFANAVVVQADGKIIAAGRVNYPGFSSSDFAMIRYTVGGEVDSSFGTNGMVITGIHEEDEVKGIVIQPDGKIILAGFASISAKGDYAMVRYLEDGSEDKSFGIGGRVITDLEGTGKSDYETCVMLDKEGKIVLGGSANYNPIQGTSDLGIVRYDKDGLPDDGFGIQGIYILHLGGNSQVEAIAQQPDGKYIVAGKSDVIGFKNQWLLARIKNEGELDATFGNQGLVVTDMVGNTNEVANAIVLQNDSRIVAGGIPGDFTKLDFTLARYIADFTMTAAITGISCAGVNDAAITIEVSGGVAPYVFSIDGINFQSSPVFSNLAAGIYTIIVRDSNGAGVSGSYGPVQIMAPVVPPVHVDVVSNMITIVVDGPGPYSYSVDGGATFQPGNIFAGLSDGAYQVIVMDENGCIIYNDIAIVQATGIGVIQDFAISLSPNPAKEYITVEMEIKGPSVKAMVVDMLGHLISSEVVIPNGNRKIIVNVNQLSAGQYTLWLSNGLKWGAVSFVKE